jgi:hypothetical protein
LFIATALNTKGKNVNLVLYRHDAIEGQQNNNSAHSQPLHYVQVSGLIQAPVALAPVPTE